MTDAHTCEFPGCGVAADKTIDGHSFCADPHHRHHRDEEPSPRCCREGCGWPAKVTVAGKSYCEPCGLWAAAGRITPEERP